MIPSVHAYSPLDERLAEKTLPKARSMSSAPSGTSWGWNFRFSERLPDLLPLLKLVVLFQSLVTPSPYQRVKRQTHCPQLTSKSSSRETWFTRTCPIGPHSIFFSMQWRSLAFLFFDQSTVKITCFISSQCKHTRACTHVISIYKYFSIRVCMWKEEFHKALLILTV